MAYLTEREKKRRKIGWIVFLSILLFLAVGSFVAIRVCRVEEVTVTGNEMYDDESIRQWVLNDKYSWSTLYVYLKYRFLDTEPVPFIDTMDVAITGMKSLAVQVYEKGLIGYIKDDTSGQNIYFDKDGFVIEISQEEIPGVSQITGLSVKDPVMYEKLDLTDRTLRTLLSLTQNLQKYALTADSIDYDGTGSISVRFGEIVVILGDESSLTEKVLRLQKILPQIMGQTGVLHLENWSEDTTDVTFERF